MKTFEYTVKDELGLHARPAGLLVKEVGKYKSHVSLTKEGKKGRCLQTDGSHEPGR